MARVVIPGARQVKHQFKLDAAMVAKLIGVDPEEANIGLIIYSDGKGYPVQHILLELIESEEGEHVVES